MSKSVPKRRFKGFEGEWEQRKLGDFGVATGGTSIESEFSENGKYKVISIGSYSENSLYNDQGIRAIESDKTIKRVLSKGDLTMILNDKTASGNIIGRVLLIEESGCYVYNQRTERIEIDNEEYDSLFIYEMLNAPNIRNKIVKKAQGNTQIYVNWSTIALIKYLVPQIEEQKKLGDFLKNLDNLINLHQQKYYKLQSLKKAYLYEMFPQEGESVPKRRFAGFSGEWKYIKFNDIVKRLSQIDNTKQLFGVEYEDIVSGRGRLCDNFHKKKILKSGIRFSKGDILYGKLRPYLMNFILADFDGVAIGDFWVLRPNENVCSELIYTLIQTDMFCEIANQSVGTKMPRADWSVVSNTYFYIPISLEEQKRIGMFFMNIDSQINRVDNKINKLKALKQAYLAEMFI